jgi:hypothetical protein
MDIDLRVAVEWACRQLGFSPHGTRRKTGNLLGATRRSVQALFPQALHLGNSCLLPNFGMAPPVLEAIATMLQAEFVAGQRAYGPGFVRALQILAGQVPPKFSRRWIRTNDFHTLMDFARLLYGDTYPRLADSLQFRDYWEPLDVFRTSRDIAQADFADWLRSLFLTSEHYGDRIDEEAYVPTETGNFQLQQRESTLLQLEAELRPKLFLSARTVASAYCLTNAQNENTPYAPYILIGDRCVIVILREWIL